MIPFLKNLTLHPIRALQGLMVAFGWLSVVAVEDIPQALLPLDSDHNVVQQKDYLQLMSGKSAAAYGFSSISETIFRDLLENSTQLDSDALEDVRYQLILTLLNQDKFEAARDFLEGFEDQSSDHFKFVSLLMAYIDRAPLEELQRRLAGLAGADMGKDQVWINVMRGIILSRQGASQESQSVLDLALESASNAFQRSWIETLIWREEIQNGRADEALLFSLKSQIDNAVNPLIASQLMQEYAIALHANGRTSDAIAAIESQLPILGNEYRDHRDRLLMLLSMLAGRDSGKSKVAIEEILTRGRSERMRSMAFYFWLSHADFSSSSQVTVLEQLFETRPNDPLRNEIAYALALSSFYRGDLNQSQARIDSVLESDAEPRLKQSALQVLVSVCWSQDPPQYRLAAEHLLRLRRLSQDAQESSHYTMLIADSYYLNGDYENAYPYYSGLMDEALDPGVKNELLYKITDSLLQLGNLDGARPILDRFHEESPEMSELIWGSEWNFNLVLVKTGRLDEAIIRMETLVDSIDRFESQDAESVETSAWLPLARLRAVWLLGFLNFQNQDYASAFAVLNGALTDSEDYLQENGEPMNPLIDELRLLGVRCLFEQGNPDLAFEFIRKIRENQVESATAASYIVEARYFLSQGNSAEAQKALMELADLFPDSDFAPVALYEAALSVESRVDETSDQEAIALYERISSQFPTHPLNLISRIRQGDLLRKSNQFALAITFYENLLSDYTNDPRKYLVEIALAESYLAMGSTRVDYVEQSVQIFERVFDRVTLPMEVRIEAGTKAAIGLDKTGRGYRAQDLLFRVLNLVNREPSTVPQVGGTGKYWLARATLMLCDKLLEHDRRIEALRLIEVAETMNLPGVTLLKNKL